MSVPVDARSVDLSVVIACLNGASTLGEQLEAIWTQRSTAGWEVVIADNGSADDSVAVAAAFAARSLPIRVVDASGRPGLAHARNVGARASVGPFLAFCDQDDRVAEGWMEALFSGLREHELVAGSLEHDLLNEPWAIAVRGRPQTDGPLELELPGWLPFAFGCTLGVRRDLHERIGGFDETFRRGGEDADYCWRAQLVGANLVFLPEAVTHYRLRHELRGIYRQARSYGESEARVYAKFVPEGIPRVRWPLALGMRRWLGMVRSFLVARNRRGWALALWSLGQRVGRLRGSVATGIPFL